jgi:DnaK suppressor protein
MDKQQLAEIRERLITRRDETHRDLERLNQEIQSLGEEQERERGTLGNHVADDGSNVMEQERIGTIAEDLRDVERQIDGALKRVDDGTYGLCQRCGKPIDPERLDALPFVEFDVECQAILERERQLYGSTSRVG